MKLGFVFILAFSLSVIGCNSSQKISKGGSVEMSSQDSATAKNPLVVSFEQTACYGTCPVHSMLIYKDGTAYYSAKRNTKITGAFTAKFSKAELEKILNTAKDFHFFDTEKEYTSPITDMPTSIIFIQYGNNSHRVSAYADYPANIKDLITYLYEVTQNTKWVKAETE